MYIFQAKVEIKVFVLRGRVCIGTMVPLFQRISTYVTSARYWTQIKDSRNNSQDVKRCRFPEKHYT